jgi:shikimate dehydrogenase
MITSSAKLYAVLGHPIAHSLSPQMQNAALRKMGLDAVYLAFDVPPKRLMAMLKAMAEMGFSGVNLTVPLKETAFRGLKKLDSSARILGSVNTVKFSGRHMKGYSTDGKGFLLALKKVFRASPRGKTIFVLGCGGAGRAVALACAQSGAAKISLADKDFWRVKKLSAEIRAISRKTDVELVPHNRAENSRSARAADLIIQATPVGMHRGDIPLLDKEAFRKGQMVYDLIYIFPETGLMKAARRQGARTANGLDMLVFQGALSFSIWTGRKAPVDVMRKVLEEAIYGSALRNS